VRLISIVLASQQIKNKKREGSMIRILAVIAVITFIAGAGAMLIALTVRVEARAQQPGTKGDRLDSRPLGAACSHRGWPHYEAQCVRDRRYPTGQARNVRIVSADRLPIANSATPNAR
jgi:hypothetical protein